MTRYKKVNELEVKAFRSNRVSWVKIATFFGVSTSHLRKWRVENSFVEPLVTLKDDELDAQVGIYLADNVNRGCVLLEAYLESEGVTAPQRKVREAMRRVDPVGVQLRTMRKISRVKKYDAHGPHYVWHMDGCHKIIRWGFVIHACIDGYSRKVVYNRCADNNKHHNQLNLLKQAATEYGFPCHVRMDKGGENVSVAWLCLKIRGDNRRSFIALSSKNNVKIERYWRDNTRCALDHYRDAFREFEEMGLLDVECAVMMFLLHHLFMKRINLDIDRMTYAWNCHKTRTLGHTSPNAMCLLWKGRSYQQETTIDEMDEAMESYKTSRGVQAPAYSVPHVQVEPRDVNVFTPEQLLIIRRDIRPLNLEDPVTEFASHMRHAIEVAKELLG
jgi:hypothetical protein